MASRNDDYDDDDEELGAYIYQTSHTAKIFREKKEADALVSTPTSQQAQRKSPRLLASEPKQQVKFIPTVVMPEKSISNTNTNITIKERTKRKRKLLSKEELCTPVCPKSSLQQKKGERYAYGQKRKLCSFDGCTNTVISGGVCLRHGAEKRRCSNEGCTKLARGKGGVCVRHGAKRRRYECKYEGCTNHIVQGGVCIRHGANKKVKICGHEGCTNNAQEGGVCIRHGAKKYMCSHKGCTNKAKQKGVCIRHGATIKRCSHDGCTNNARKGGVCWRHGAR